MQVRSAPTCHLECISGSAEVDSLNFDLLFVAQSGDHGPAWEPTRIDRGVAGQSLIRVGRLVLHQHGRPYHVDADAGREDS